MAVTLAGDIQCARKSMSSSTYTATLLYAAILLCVHCHFVVATKAATATTTTTTTADVVSTVCERNECCTQCPAGYGVWRACNVTGGLLNNDTQCETCEAGVTYSDRASVDAPCRTCSACPADSHVKRACNVTHDTVCECDRDHYQELSVVSLSEISSGDADDADNDNRSSDGDANEIEPRATVAASARRKQRSSSSSRHRHDDREAGDKVLVMSCKACDLCPHGWGAARPCSSQHNTVCRKCPAGTFRSVLSASLGCVVCSACREDQVTLHSCTPIQDTVCADVKMGQHSRRVISKPADNEVHQTDEYSNEGIISVYCAILGAIVLGLLIYVVMKQWRLRSAANKLAHFDPRNGGSAAVPLNGSCHLNVSDYNKHAGAHQIECEISPCGSRRMQESDGSRGSRGSDSAFVAPGSDGYSRDSKPITLDTRLRDICTAKRREMEVMLNGKRDQRDWKALARDLGYTSSRIASFEQKSLEKQTGPTRHLFADWAKREDSTVANILQSLCNIGRHDVTLVLLPIQQKTSNTLPRPTLYKPISIV